MPPRTAGQGCEHFLSRWRKAEAVGAAVAVHSSALDEATLDQILDNGSKAGFVAAICEG